MPVKTLSSELVSPSHMTIPLVRTSVISEDEMASPCHEATDKVGISPTSDSPSTSPQEHENSLSPHEAQDLQRLEQQFECGQRESIVALREIRERKLYRGDYETFDAYMAQRWGRTRQWATQKLNWLRRVELLEKIGKNPYQSLSVDDAQVVGSLEDYPEDFVRAITEADEEARQAGKKRTAKMLRAAVGRQEAYIARRCETPDLTYDENLQLESLENDRSDDPALLEESEHEAAENNRSLAESLIEMCQKHKTLPTDKHLLAVARGEELAAICHLLVDLQAEWKQDSELDDQEKQLRAELDQIERKRKAKQAAVAANLAARPDDLEVEPKDEADEDAEDESIEEFDEIEAPEYRVRATGDFVELLGADEDPAEDELSLSEFIEQMNNVLRLLAKGMKLTCESSLTVSPLAQSQQE